jgi:MFS family permease
MSSRPTGYLGLLRQNQAFRRLWYGQVTSQLGDWLDFIALNTLLLRLTGSLESIGWLLVAQCLPAAVVGLWAGVVVDRLPRRLVMIVADLGCAVLVLAFLLVRDESQVWIVYVATALKYALVAFFEPAREAVVPSITPREDLVAANALGGLTWSVMLTGGAALGGLIAGALGTNAAFLLDAASFLVSAAWTWSVPVTETHLEGQARRHPLQELVEGLQFLRERRDVAIYALSKTLWSFGAGVLVLLTMVGQSEPFRIGEGGATSIGILYAARGVGAGIGPVLAQRLGGTSERFLRRALGPGFLLMALGYALLAQAPSLTWVCVALVLAHCGGSVQWVFSTTLLQINVPGHLQGRVFAVELTMFTLVMALSSYCTGLAADAGLSTSALSLALAAVFVPPGLALIALLWRVPPEKQPGASGE